MGSPVKLSAEAIRKYMVEFGEGRSPATVKMQVAAIRFLYEVTLRSPERVARLYFPKVPRRLPDILTLDEVLRLLDAVVSLKHRLVLMSAYGAGMRISEACSLLTTDIDIDSARGVIHLRHCKRGRERYTVLSQNLLVALRGYWKLCRPVAPPPSCSQASSREAASAMPPCVPISPKHWSPLASPSA